MSAVKIEITPDILNRIRVYAEAFASCRPAILTLFAAGAPDATDASDASGASSEDASLFPFAADSDRGLGILLLASALHRPGAPGSAGFGAGAASVIAGLYRGYGNDVFRLNRLPFETLRTRTDALAATWDDAERARIPGILRSVCDFFFRVGPLGTWLADADWEQRAGELAQEIYWMGARSSTRTKARLFFWLACQIPGFGARADMRPRALRFTWPVSDGHMRVLFDIFKPARGSIAALRRPEGRGEAFAELARRVFPDEPWRLYRPFEAFLCPDGQGGFQCRAVQGGCRPCALAPLCPAAPHFLARERAS